jgi:hypothetical protein
VFGRLRAVARAVRPRALLRTAKSVDDLTSGARELRQAVKTVDAAATDLQERAQRLEAEVRELKQLLGEVSVRESQLRAIYRRDVELTPALDALPGVLDLAAIATHVRRAIAAAPMFDEPFPHAVVTDMWPEEFYDALIRGIPPLELFNDRAINKQRLVVPFEDAPIYSRRVWGFLVNEVLDAIVAPAFVEKFREPLDAWLAESWPALEASPTKAIRFQSTDGRILLRRPGYLIPPHRDPKWGFLTCLVYLVRPGDSERWGTQLFSVDSDVEAPSVAPHWIRAAQCRLQKDIPFRRNTALVFLNSAGAHGAQIPADAQPPDLERYVYQFRVGPTSSAIRQLMALLPEERRQLWAGKVSDYA